MPLIVFHSRRVREALAKPAALGTELLFLLMVGAFVGGWLFSSLGVLSPWGGVPGTIFIAFMGAVVLLFLLRLIRGVRRTV